MQKIECFNCGKPLNLNADTAGNVYKTRPGIDDKPRARFDEKGNPVKGEKSPAAFHIDDRRMVTRQVAVKREVSKGMTEDVTEDVTVEEPKTVECPKCGYQNLIY